MEILKRNHKSCDLSLWFRGAWYNWQKQIFEKICLKTKIINNSAIYNLDDDLSILKKISFMYITRY